MPRTLEDLNRAKSEVQLLKTEIAKMSAVLTEVKKILDEQKIILSSYRADLTSKTTSQVLKIKQIITDLGQQCDSVARRIGFYGLNYTLEITGPIISAAAAAHSKNDVEYVTEAELAIETAVIKVEWITKQLPLMEQDIDKEIQEITTQRVDSITSSPSASTTAQSVSLTGNHACYFGLSREPYKSTRIHTRSSFSEDQLQRIDARIIDLTTERDACIIDSSRQLKDEKITALNLLKEISYRYKNPKDAVEEFDYQAKLTIIESGHSSRVKELLDELRAEAKIAAPPKHGK